MPDVPNTARPLGPDFNLLFLLPEGHCRWSLRPQNPVSQYCAHCSNSTMVPIPLAQPCMRDTHLLFGLTILYQLARTSHFLVRCAAGRSVRPFVLYFGSAPAGSLVLSMKRLSLSHPTDPGTGMMTPNMLFSVPSP